MKRIWTALVLTAVLIALWVIRGPVVRALFWVMTAAAAMEMTGIMKKSGMRLVTAAPIAYAVLAMPVYMLKGSGAMLPLFMLCAIIGISAVILKGEPDFEAVLATLFPMVYPVLMMTMIYPLQDLSSELLGALAMALCFTSAFLSDVGAWAVGRKFGKHKLIPQISPKKTVEGAAGGLIGAVLAAPLTLLGAKLIISLTVSPEAAASPVPNVWLLMAVSLFAGAVSQLGDLAASTVKRYCGVKDYGSLLPGHGGVMDRIDSLLFSGVVWNIFFTIFIGG